MSRLGGRSTALSSVRPLYPRGQSPATAHGSVVAASLYHRTPKSPSSLRNTVGHLECAGKVPPRRDGDGAFESALAWPAPIAALRSGRKASSSLLSATREGGLGQEANQRHGVAFGLQRADTREWQ